MCERLRDKVAIVVGAGQTPGDTMGNGRAISILFAREGARVMAVDRNMESAIETQLMIKSEGNEAFAFEADVTNLEDCKRMADTCAQRFGRIDVLVNNVGIGEGDRGPVELQEEVWDRILDTNLKGMYLTCKSVLPYMEGQGSGAIVNISSAAAVCYTPMLAYKTSKAGVNALTQAIAMRYASKGIRVNAVMPGLMNTPMAIEGFSRALGIPKEEVIEMRNRLVPLKGGMGDAWDTARAVLFLASDEAKFITGVILPVDGGQCAKIG